MMPPISAWLELDGSPKNHVIRFQVIAPVSPASTMSSVTAVGIDDPLRDRGGNLDRDERPEEVEDGGHGDGRAGGESFGRYARGDRVRRVVEAVREVEEERDDHDGDELDVQLGYVPLTRMFATTFAAVSQASRARSSAS